MRHGLVASAALLLAACSRSPAPVHVASVRLAADAASQPLREAGVDEAALDGAARAALREAGFRLGDGTRPHRARVDVLEVRLRPARADGSPRAEVTIEIELAPSDPAGEGPRREAGTATVPLGGGASPREAFLAAVAQAARRAADGLALSFAEESKSAEELVADLSAGDERVREHAIRLLGDRRSRAAVPALVARLREEEPRLATRVVAALAQIGDERAVPALIDLARSADPAATARLVRFVGDIGGAEAQGYLLTLESGHPDRRVRGAAREALAEMQARADEAALASRK